MLKIRVPATSANLGPGFDCLGLALDLWNEVSFELSDRTSYHVKGEGARSLNGLASNLLAQAMGRLYQECGKKMGGVRITAKNSIPPSSGLGSSAAAIVAGLYGANGLLGRPLDMPDLLKLGTQLEGHPDNIAPALLGGLVISVPNGDELLTRRFDVPEWTAVIVIPEVDWPTHLARAVLPDHISRADAVFNIGRTPLVVDALQRGDMELLQKGMEDRLHQGYRLAHIRGGEAAFQVARTFGPSALSGAGPSLITFIKPGRAHHAGAATADAFMRAGVKTRSLVVRSNNSGVQSFEDQAALNPS